ncbi:uncharacterized protein LOC113359140 [Papaver somniferum]|uniref:uncharacterized protein LOC113359140 n=1 Tax=Papaver somniferum TaxID=3469 RepID=UPI000E6FE2E0|nr:uncharacterized protein LOC113359140 [Papaver somniferum]
MTQYVQNFDGCKCFIGDFNAICSKNEKYGGQPVLNSNIAYFNNFIQQNHLIDLGYKGPAYTWSNGRCMDNLIRQRLDRVLTNIEWCVFFSFAAVLHLPRLASDHAPILLNTYRNISRSPPNYKFEAMCLSHPEFLDKVREYLPEDSDENIQSKLRKLGGFLTEWSRTRIGCVKHKISFLKNKLLRIQSWRPTAANIQRENLVITELNDYLIMEDTYWDQRMKQQWAKDGDRNTRHFHLSVQQRRRKNTIIHLLVDNQVCNGVHKAVKEIFETACLPDLLNHTNITLIPKIKNPESPSDFRPISLCNVLCNIATKFLSNRLKPYLEEFICWSQNAFVPGRQILDNIIIAKEFLHSMNNSKAKNGHFALKVDMEKAYDRDSWSFLGDMLKIMGVSGIAHSLIMTCVSTASFSINLNGSPQGLFRSERGIRQGYPLSPTLFIICSQGLSLLIIQAEIQGLYQGYKLNRWAPNINHLMFADDLFFFGENTRTNVRNLMKLLDDYAKLSGQMINYEKSSIHFSKGIHVWMRQTTIQDMGVRDMAVEDKYLGIYPLKSDYQISSFGFLVDKLTSKLPGWRIHYVNSAGRTVSQNLLSLQFLYIPWVIACYLKGVTHEMKKVQLLLLVGTFA